MQVLALENCDPSWGALRGALRELWVGVGRLRS